MLENDKYFGSRTWAKGPGDAPTADGTETDMETTFQVSPLSDAPRDGTLFEGLLAIPTQAGLGPTGWFEMFRGKDGLLRVEGPKLLSDVTASVVVGYRPLPPKG